MTRLSRQRTYTPGRLLYDFRAFQNVLLESDACNGRCTFGKKKSYLSYLNGTKHLTVVQEQPPSAERSFQTKLCSWYGTPSGRIVWGLLGYVYVYVLCQTNLKTTTDVNSKWSPTNSKSQLDQSYTKLKHTY